MKIKRKNEFLDLSKRNGESLVELNMGARKTAKYSWKFWKQPPNVRRAYHDTPYCNLHWTYISVIFRKQGSQPTKNKTPTSPKISNFGTKKSVLTSSPVFEVSFDIQPTNPQADIVATGCCKYWITAVDLMKHQGNDTESPSDDPVFPEVYTATVACIYNKGLQGVTRMAYSPSLWLMAIGWWNKINQCRKLKLNLTRTWGVCMSLDSGMHWSPNQWYCDDK